jgi:hypothetical protein
MAQIIIKNIKHDAFTLKPEEIDTIDWLCSDVICYPPRLYEWVEHELTWVKVAKPPVPVSFK